MKTSKLLITSLLAAAALSTPAFAETTSGTLLPEFYTAGESGALTSNILRMGGEPSGWDRAIGGTSISASAVAKDLSLSSTSPGYIHSLADQGWHWGNAQLKTDAKENGDVTVSQTGFTFTNRPGYTGEFVAATVDVGTLLGESASNMKISGLSVSFNIQGQVALGTGSFSVYSWDGTTATELFKNTQGAPAAPTEISFSDDTLSISGREKLLFVWNNSTGGHGSKTVTISNLTSSYTASTYSTLYWRGGDATWSTDSMTWSADSSAGSGDVTATSFDDVIFDSSATVAVDSAGVAVDRLTISAGTVSFTGGAVAVESGLALSDGTTLSLNGTSVNTGFGTTIGANAQLTVSGDGALNTTITSVGSNAQLVLGGTGANAVRLNSAIGENAVVSVSGNSAVTGTITSMAAGSSLTLAGTGASAVTLNGAIGANAVVNVSGNSALAGTITSMGAGSSLTLAGTGASTVEITGAIANTAAIAVDNGSVTWSGQTLTTSADITIGTNGVFTTKSQWKYSATLSGTLSGEGTFAAWAPTTEGQTDYARVVRLSGNASGFTGELQLDTTYDSSTANRRVFGVLNPSNGVFGGVVAFKSNLDGKSTDVVESAECARLYILKDTEIGGLDGALSGNLVGGASSVSDTAVVQEANHALTINVADGKSYDYAGKIDSTISLKKTGSGTQILSGDNSAYAGTTTLEAGTLGVGHANALGTSTVNVTGNAKLALGEGEGEGLGISNNISIADSVKLTLGGGYSVALNGAITGSGTLRADMPGRTLALGGDNSGFSGGVEVVGMAVDANHASALGTGMVKISSAVSTFGPVPGSIQANTADVALHDVSIELVRTDSAALRTSSSCSFIVASGATLYLDIGLLTEATLTGEEVALTIAARNAIDSFFADVQVGTYVDDAWQISSEWKYLAGSWDVGAGTLKISAIPEPSVFGLLAGLGALALAGTRRRRKKA